MRFLGVWTILVTNGEPTSGHNDVYSVGTPEGASWGKHGQNDCNTTFSPLGTHGFLIAKGLHFSFGSCWSACYMLVGPVTQDLCTGVFLG